jgi:serine---pyruvate transaminase
VFPVFSEVVFGTEQRTALAKDRGSNENPRSMKEYLFTPGPTSIPDRIFSAMAKGTMHHRTKEFESEFVEALKGIQWLTGASETPILLAASGTGAMEASLLNVVSPGDKVMVINAGVFGERWVKICQKLGLVPIELKAPPGESVPLHDIEEALKANPDTKAFAVQYTETSTTVNHPVPEIGAVLRKNAPDVLYFVDAVSSLATIPISLPKLGIDVLVGGSQKGLMLPPGLSMVVMSARAWAAVRSKKSRTLYFDLLAERSAHEKGTTAWTPAMNLILGLNETFRMFKEEGIENVYKRHAELAKAARQALKALGFKLLTEKYPSTGVTGAYPPGEVDAEKLRETIQRDSGVKIAGGQDQLKGKIIRIGHMGYVNRFDILTAISSIELALKGKIQASLGAGVNAALGSFAEDAGV